MATRKKHTPEQVVRKLAIADRMLNDLDRPAPERAHSLLLHS
jgi:hypothetical protein